MQSSQPEIDQNRILTEGKLIGHLLLGCEGRPIRYADQPEAITLSGVLLTRAREIWVASTAAGMLNEHSVVGTTFGDRKLHLPKDLQMGDPEKVLRRIHWEPNMTGAVVGIHSHAIKDTQPSNHDVASLLYGKFALQGELITTASAYFLLVRTDQTPNLGMSTSKLLQKLEELNDRELKNYSNLAEKDFHKALSGSELNLPALLNFFEKQISEENNLVCRMTVETCFTLKLGLYFCLKNGSDSTAINLQKVSKPDGLSSYAINLETRIVQNTSELIRKRQRELHPELKTIDPRILTAQDIEQIEAAINKFLSIDEFQRRNVTNFLNVLDLYNQRQNQASHLDKSQLIAVLLEKGDFDPEDSSPPSGFAVGGMVLLLSELGII